MMNWKCKEFKITKYENVEDYKNNKPSSIESHHGNAVTNNGLLAMWIFATGATADNTSLLNALFGEENVSKLPANIYTPFSVNDSKISIGTGSTQVTGTETQLANELAKLPVTEIKITPASSSYASITFSGEAGTDVANGEWNEWGIYNTDNGILFNRKVESMGTKKSGSIWTVQVTIDLARSAS